ncbi:aldo/keto reductase [Cyanobium sp. BA5m-10]|uniref:aldo/keto reductase n=1 Tax=Cyanobium sp. BA5m-10 TaxID=2823705 RepID=UPI0020CD041E|nr:aldo/keto reductase [Cyanobium sp. BA5m-10]MCP9904866.1 aldo/keto reductase [Cyanobium sp. BA5m-10]
MKPKICLGSAQFGLPYGITNTSGQVAEAEVRALLVEAAAAGLTLLDTAQAYGDAEAVLGRTLPPGHGFQLISKLPAQSQPSFTADDHYVWDQALKSSLVRLGQPSLDALLLHSAQDLCKPGGEHLREWLLSLRQRGLVKRLGVSIYDSSDLYGVPPDLLDLVQMPLSLYDQRLLAEGTITCLRAQGCAVHARSLYLQGLLVSLTASWPAWVEASAREHHARLEKLAADRGCTLLEFALGFARAQQDLEAVVLGVCSRRELEQLLQAWHNSSPWDGNEWSDWSLDRSQILDPRRWPQSKA